MSTSTSPAVTTTRHGLSLWGTIRSEWIKLRSVQSTWWIYVVVVILTLGIGTQMSSSTSFEGVSDAPSQIGMQAAGVYALTISTDINVLVMGVLGVLVITSEYSTGMIRSTFTAVPRRVPALLAKSLVFAALTFVIGVLVLAATVPISRGLLAGNGIDIRLDDAEYWRALVGSVGYLVVVGLIGLGIGAILRNIAGGIAVTLGLVFVVPLAMGLLAGVLGSQVWLRNLTALLPFNLGRALYTHPGYDEFVSPGLPIERPDGLLVLEPWQAALGLIAWVVVLFTVAIVLLKRRDA